MANSIETPLVALLPDGSVDWEELGRRYAKPHPVGSCEFPDLCLSCNPAHANCGSNHSADCSCACHSAR